MMEDKKTILVVDDEAALVELIKIRLTKAGYEVLTAGNGKEALEILHDIAPDLIILDINMPVMGGVELYHRIYEKTGHHPQYPVIFLTVREEMEEMFTHDLEAAGFIPKPFKFDHLMSEIERVLKGLEKGGDR